MSEIAAARPAPLHGHTAAHRRTPPHTAAHRRILAPRPPCASSQSSPSLPLSLPPSHSGGGGLTPEEYARQMARELRLPPDLQARQRHRANQSYASPDPRPSPAAPPLRSLAVPTRPPIGRLLHPPAASRPPQAAAALALRRETQGLLRPALRPVRAASAASRAIGAADRRRRRRHGRRVRPAGEPRAKGAAWRVARLFTARTRCEQVRPEREALLWSVALQPAGTKRGVSEADLSAADRRDRYRKRQ